MYRILKIEYIKHRPKWLTRLLMEIRPIYYDKTERIEDARSNLVQIMNIVISSRHLKNDIDLLYNHDCFKVIYKKSGACPIKFILKQTLA